MSRQLRSIGILAVIMVIMIFALVPVAGAAPARQATDKVVASDQPVVGGAITVANVTAAADGWIVAHLDEGGKPGKVLGQTLVKAGTNANVQIKLSQAVDVGAKLWPMLHLDAGTAGTYEFPGPDVPIKDAAGNIVMVQISVTAAPTAPAAPTNLPKTGGADAPLGLLLAGLVLLGAGTLLARRTRRA
ncbi:MAG: LPXTG cell wall anchor domain-containing protein [Kouleothrix sp.]|jgi:LPXTG-motif cell wall-anchored protein|nr:LPXTG cell wall anchor domain-containing protein [Kouleothrix sp.]